MTTLDEFLYVLEFDYKVNDDNTISLIDLLQVNLGNIEEEKFKINSKLPGLLVDRLDNYIHDCLISGIEDTLYHDCQYKDDTYPYDEKLIPAMKKYSDVFDEGFINFVQDIVTANIDISKLMEA